jgi:hypothetical protein
LVRRAVLAMTHSYPQGYIPIADAWQEACSKLAPPQSKPLDNATFDDHVAYDARVRIVERLMRNALVDGLLPVFVQTKNGETERLTDREQWRAAALVPDTANIPEPVTTPGPETDGRPALLKVSDFQEWIRRAAPIDAVSVADEVEKDAIASQQKGGREFAERAFNKPDWSAYEAISWLAWRDPTLICEIPDHRNLEYFIWYPDQFFDGDSIVEIRDPNPHDTLLLALKAGRLSAIKDGTQLSRDYWCGKEMRDLSQVHFWRENILALWPAGHALRSALEAAYAASTGRWLDQYRGRIKGSKADAADTPAGYDVTSPSNATSAHSPAAVRWASSNADETRCFKWLVKKMQVAPDRPETKIVLWPEAKEHFRGLSERGFNRVWIAAATESGASKWSFQGRRSKRK